MGSGKGMQISRYFDTNVFHKNFAHEIKYYIKKFALKAIWHNMSLCYERNGIILNQAYTTNKLGRTNPNLNISFENV